MYRILMVLLMISTTVFSQSEKKGTISPDSSTQHDSSSTAKGLLPSKMNFLQRNAIQNPATGLIVWCTDCGPSGELQVYNGTSWTNMIGHTAATPISVISLGTQVWTSKNLNVTTYRNGDPITQVTNMADWADLTTGAWCYYNNDPSLDSTYGKLYNWYAVTDPRGLAPAGFHIPDESEWAVLATFLGGNSVAGGKMKETSGLYWQSPNVDASNSSNFSALPGGYRTTSSFEKLTFWGEWWSRTEFNSSTSIAFALQYDNGELKLFHSNKKAGFSVRCIKN